MPKCFRYLLNLEHSPKNVDWKKRGQAPNFQ